VKDDREQKDGSRTSLEKSRRDDWRPFRVQPNATVSVQGGTASCALIDGAHYQETHAYGQGGNGDWCAPIRFALVEAQDDQRHTDHDSEKPNEVELGYMLPQRLLLYGIDLEEKEYDGRWDGSDGLVSL
jgi:hypothetical protein